MGLSTPHGTLGTHGALGTEPSPEDLSTPHGTLGTRSDVILITNLKLNSFNSTRCIRNFHCFFHRSLYSCVLSTPHGTLGTIALIP